MVIMKISCTVLIIYFVLIVAVRCEYKLELVQVLFRHGDRTPLEIEIIPNDNKGEDFYHKYGGYGQLTKKGKLREFRLGETLRSYYDGFLGNYMAENIYAYSSNFDRTKTSLQLTLAGLFPPTNDSSWNDNLRWLPIPTFTLPMKLDMLLNPQQCPSYSQEHGEVGNSLDFKNRLAQYEEFFKYLSEKTGHENPNLRTVHLVYNILMAHESMNVLWPDWVTTDVLQKIKELVTFNYEYLSYTTSMKSLQGGTMVRRFIRNLDSSKKLFLYCGHDTNVAAFIRAHNLTYPNLPDFGTAVIMEKHRDSNNKIYIKMMVWDGATSQMSPMKLPNCDYFCPLHTYKKIMAEVVPSDDAMRCLIENLPESAINNIINGDVGDN